MTTSLMQSEKVLSYGAIVIAAAVLLTGAVSSEVLAQTTTNSTASKNATTASTSTTALSNITGSIPLRSTINNALSSKVKTTLNDAITIAQKSAGTNTSATLAFIRPLNGYLVYDVHVRNNSNNTTTAVIVDAGNGKVLYKQTPPSLIFGNFGFGQHGTFGQGKMGPWFGGHGYGGGQRGFWYHGGDSGMTMGQSSHMVPMDSIPARV